MTITRRLYSSEQRVAVLSRYFAGIAIIISCLGLFGLAAFTAQKRQKEIGIRKVVGASASNIATMLSKDFLKLVLVALLIAIPLSWWAANQWLQSFAYRVTVSAGVFVMSGSVGYSYYFINHQFPGNKSSNCKPGQKLKNGINNLEVKYELIKHKKFIYDKKLFQNSISEYF